MARMVDGEMILLDRGRGQVHQFNVTAAWIWRCCDGRSSVDEIARSMAARFNADVEGVESDVVDAVLQFDALGLLEPPGAKGSGRHA